MLSAFLPGVFLYSVLNIGIYAVLSYGTGFASFVNQLDSSFFPVQENGGIGGISSRDGKENIDKLLSTSPAKYVSIAYGTNDAWGNPNNAQSYYENTKYMIDAVLNAGKVPVLPKIPYATNPDVGSNTGYYSMESGNNCRQFE